MDPVGIGSLVLFAPKRRQMCILTKEKKPDLILVEKEKLTITLFSKGQAIKSYNVVWGFSPVGHKKEEGDRQTPEGNYKIIAKNPNSHFYLSLKINYPSAEDQKQAAMREVLAGGNIMIHGLGKKFGWIGKAHVLKDWTLGCIAVANEEIKEIYTFVDVGTTVKIVP
jgi:murein L,D-transpeptidase YafK